MGRDSVSIERHFGLTAAPFSAARDQAPLPHVTSATATIADAVRSGKLTLLLTGGPGSGKTAALAHLTDLLANPGDTVKLMQADHLPKDEYYRYTHVLLLDEAQAVPQDVLKPLVKARARQGHVTIIAAPERMSLMLRPLVDREVILDGLTTKAAIVYLRDQALAVGGSPDLFSEPAARRLAGSASGSIWTLRNLAGKALVSAMLAGRNRVLPEDVDGDLFPEVPQEKPEPAATPALINNETKPPARTETTGTQTASTGTIRAAGLIAAAAATAAKPQLASASSVPPAPTLVSAEPSAAAPAPEPIMHAAVRRRGSAPARARRYWPVAAALATLVAIATGWLLASDREAEERMAVLDQAQSAQDFSTDLTPRAASKDIGEMAVARLDPPDMTGEETDMIAADVNRPDRLDGDAALAGLSAPVADLPAQESATQNPSPSVVAKPAVTATGTSKRAAPGKAPPAISILYRADSDVSAVRATGLGLALQEDGWAFQTMRGVNFDIAAPTLRYYQAEQAENVAALRDRLPAHLKGDLAAVTPHIVDFSKIAEAPDGTIELLIP